MSFLLIHPIIHPHILFTSRAVNMPHSSSSSSSSSISSSSSSRSSSTSSSSSSSSWDEGKSVSFSFSKSHSNHLAKWVVTGIANQKIKEARESFKPKLKNKEGIFTNPTLDDDVYTELKSIKRSSASKANIDPLEKEYHKLCFKILDLAKPLLFLAKRRKSRRKSKKDAQAIKAALRLWTTLYRDVLATRRRNILAQVYPRFMGLLEDASLFKGGDLLFGPKFVNKLVGHAQAQNTLKQIRPPPATNQHSARRSNDNRHSDKRQQDRRQHRGNYDGSINNSEYETIFLTFHKSCGGCTTRHIDAWQNNLHSPTQRNVCRAILFLFLRTMSLSFCTDFVSLPITTIFYLQ